MSKPENAASRSPAQQTGEEFGKIKRPQQTDATMQDDDTARGSEVETRNASNNRG
jgi:hypothetical protein